MFYLFVIIIAALFVVFVWSLLSSKKHSAAQLPSSIPQDLQGGHVAHLPQIRRALAPGDFEFASKRIPRDALRRMRRERRQVALSYLSALRSDLDSLLWTGRVVASLSPEVVAGQELQRLFLTVNFHWRYRLIRMSVWAGLTPLPQINDLGNLLSSYSVRLEEAMKEMGERAALVAEMVSSPDRRGIHPV